MVERRPGLTLLSHLILVLGVVIIAFPLYLTFVASTQTAEQITQSIPMSMIPGTNLIETYKTALFGGETSAGSSFSGAGRMLWVSLMTALIIPIGKTTISLLSAFAIVYFRFPFRDALFWLIFITLMLPVEVRIGPTYEVVAAIQTELPSDSAEGFRYNEYTGSDEKSFAEYVKFIGENKLYDTGVQISPGDKLLTLSTCAYHTENGRFIVIAKKI